MPIVLGEKFSFDQSIPSQSFGEIEAEERTTIIVLGAGLAGLTCAFRLAQRAERRLTQNDLLVLERESNVGGRVRSLQIGARVLNLGALTFQPEHYPRHSALLAELGLTDKVRAIPRHRMIFGDDDRRTRADNFSLAYEGAKSFFGSGVLTSRQAQSLLRFYFFHRRVTAPEGGAELMALHEISMAEWATRFGFDRDLQRKIVEPFAYLCFCPPEKISAAFGVFLLGSNLSHPANLAGGFGQVTDAMAQRLNGLIETDAMALAATREPGGFAIVYAQRGKLRRVHSRCLVVAIPANAAAKIVPEMRERASAVQYGAGHGTVVAGRLKTDADLFICRATGKNESPIFGGEAQADGRGSHYMNLLTYRGENSHGAASQLFVGERMEKLAEYSIVPAVAAPKPGQKPLPSDWGEGLYMAGDCV